MLFVKFIRKVQFVQVRLFGDDPPGSQALCSWRRATQRDLLWPFSSSWRSGFRTASRDYFTSTGEGVSTSSLACRMLQNKERKRGKKKKRGGKDENFCSTMVREQAETGGSMKHPRCTFIGSHEQIYSCDAIPGYSRA